MRGDLPQVQRLKRPPHPSPLPKGRGRTACLLPEENRMSAPESRFAGSDAALAEGAVEMAHGAGGRATAELVRTLFHRHFNNEWLAQANDQAAFEVAAGRMVMSTDAHVISPLFFPGGDIGSLSVHGTINDVAMAGRAAALPFRRLRAGGRLSAQRSRTHRRQHGAGFR